MWFNQKATTPTVQFLGISGGYRGTQQTIGHMRDAILGIPKGLKVHEGAHHPEVRFLAQKIVSDVPSKDYVGEAQAIFDFMRKRVRYTLDPRGLEWVQTPRYTLLVVGQGDCDDHSVAACALAVSLGHACALRTVAGDASRPTEFSHVYALIGVRKNGKLLWLAADSTEKGAKLGHDPPRHRVTRMKDWIVVPG